MEAEGESPTVPNLLELPRDVTTNILHRLDVIEIVTSACQVCPLWWNICKDPFMWRTIHMTNIGASLPYDLVKICCYAVERSCGNLEDIDIEYFCTDDLLTYLADRTSQLRRMRLSNCWEISDKGFNEVAKKLSLLEELDISFCKLSTDSLEVIGRCCPLLKSLKFRRMFREDIKCDDEAFAIAKTMAELRHLDFNGNILTNDGLIAILNGCPLLESLDLRGCLHLVLSGSLGKRCAQQIKELHVDRCDSYFDYVRKFGKNLADYYSDSELDNLPILL